MNYSGKQQQNVCQRGTIGKGSILLKETDGNDLKTKTNIVNYFGYELN